MTQTRRPCRRKHDLASQELGVETLLYDESTHRAFCLDGIASAVWSRCDGLLTAAEIGSAASLSVDAVQVALARFEADDLLETGVGAGETFAAAAALSRRRLMRNFGTGAALLLPGVVTVLAPQAAQAYSGCFDCSTPSSRRAARRAVGAPANQPGPTSAPSGSQLPGDSAP